MALDIFPLKNVNRPTICEFHCVERYSEPLLEEINVLRFELV